MRRATAILLTLLVSACAPAVRLTDRPAEPIWFIHPKTHVAIGGLTGVDIPVQIWIEEHPDNRQVLIAWDGPGCYGSSTKTMDGEYEPNVYPAMHWLKVRMQPGVCLITALLIGPGGKVRHRATLAFTVCGGSLDGGCEDRASFASFPVLWGPFASAGVRPTL